MAVDFALQLRRDLLVVLEGGPVLGRLLVHGDLDSSTFLVLAGYRRPGEQGRVGAQKAHLHAYVLQTVVLVEEQGVDFAQPLAIPIVDLVIRVALFIGQAAYLLRIVRFFFLVRRPTALASALLTALAGAGRRASDPFDRPAYDPGR